MLGALNTNRLRSPGAGEVVGGGGGAGRCVELQSLQDKCERVPIGGVWSGEWISELPRVPPELPHPLLALGSAHDGNRRAGQRSSTTTGHETHGNQKRALLFLQYAINQCIFLGLPFKIIFFSSRCTFCLATGYRFSSSLYQEYFPSGRAVG